MSDKKHTLLFVDDEEDIISALYDTFSDDYNVFKTTDPKEALKMVEEEDISVIVSDQRMPEMTGSELLAEIFNKKPETMRILLTGYADINAAVDAINKGAIHKYVQKPWDDDELMELVAQLVDIYDETVANLSVISRVDDIMQNETSFREILDNIKEGVCSLKVDGTVNFANNSAATILHFKSFKDMDSKNIFNFQASDIDDFKKEFEASKKVKGKIFTVSGGDEEQVDVLLTPVLEKNDNNLVGVIFQGI